MCGLAVCKPLSANARAIASPADPVVISDMRATRPVTVDGSKIAESPSMSSSPGSVADLRESVVRCYHATDGVETARTCSLGLGAIKTHP